MIEIRGLQKAFGAVGVLRGIDLDIADGEVVALIGRSGCGKTTLLRCINFLETYEAGEIRLDGQPLWYGGESPAHSGGLSASNGVLHDAALAAMDG